MSASKDKRTKEQLLQTLSEVLSQEEMWSEKIQSLEIQLADCQKQLEYYNAELNLSDLPSSKIPFRIDYYKTSEQGAFKGVIEHLPSRQKKSFKGAGFRAVADFLQKYLPAETLKEAAEPERPAALAPRQAAGASTLLQRLQNGYLEETFLADHPPAASRAQELPPPLPLALEEPLGVVLYVAPEGMPEHAGVLAATQGFRVDIPTAGWPQAVQDCAVLNVRLTAENMETGDRRYLADTKMRRERDGWFSFPVPADSLPPGAYRLRASIASPSNPGLVLGKGKRALLVMQ